MLALIVLDDDAPDPAPAPPKPPPTATVAATPKATESIVAVDWAVAETWFPAVTWEAAINALVVVVIVFFDVPAPMAPDIETPPVLTPRVASPPSATMEESSRADRVTLPAVAVTALEAVIEAVTLFLTELFE